MGWSRLGRLDRCFTSRSGERQERHKGAFSRTVLTARSARAQKRQQCLWLPSILLERLQNNWDYPLSSGDIWSRPKRRHIFLVRLAGIFELFLPGWLRPN